MKRKQNLDRAVSIQIEQLTEIGPVVHQSHGQENWYFRTVRDCELKPRSWTTGSTYKAGQLLFVKIG